MGPTDLLVCRGIATVLVFLRASFMLDTVQESSKLNPPQLAEVVVLFPAVSLSVRWLRQPALTQDLAFFISDKMSKKGSWCMKAVACSNFRVFVLAAVFGPSSKSLRI